MMCALNKMTPCNHFNPNLCSLNPVVYQLIIALFKLSKQISILLNKLYWLTFSSHH